MCMCAYVHVCMHMCVCVYVCMHMCACVHVCMCVHIVYTQPAQLVEVTLYQVQQNFRKVSRAEQRESPGGVNVYHKPNNFLEMYMVVCGDSLLHGC